MPKTLHVCPYCASPSYKSVLEVMGSDLDTYSVLIEANFVPPVYYNECSACGLTYRSQTFTNEEAARLYQSAYRMHILKNCTAEEYFEKVIHIPAEQSELDAKIAHVADLLRNKPIQTVIDIGCGVGAFMYKLHARNPALRVFGIEPTADFARVASSKNHTHVVQGAYAGENLSAYDLITCVHVLEHTERPWEFLDLVSRNMRVGAYLYVETPSVRDINVLPANHDRFMSPHNYLFSAEFLGQRITERGLAVLDSGYAKTHRGKIDLRLFAVKKEL